MKLIIKTTGHELKTGDIVRDFRGAVWIFEGGRPPQHEGSTGKVWLHDLTEKRMTQEFYPSVIGAEWVE